MRSPLRGLILALSIGTGAITSVPGQPAAAVAAARPRVDAELAAKVECPRDVMVWLNIQQESTTRRASAAHAPMEKKPNRPAIVKPKWVVIPSRANDDVG